MSSSSSVVDCAPAAVSPCGPRFHDEADVEWPDRSSSDEDDEPVTFEDDSDGGEEVGPMPPPLHVDGPRPLHVATITDAPVDAMPQSEYPSPFPSPSPLASPADASPSLSPAPSAAAAAPAAAASSSSRSGRTHLADVVAWRQLSFQYALAYGVSADGSGVEPIAVYDKTFREPQWRSVGSWKEKFAMGVLTKKSIHEKHLANALRTAHKVTDLLSFIFDESSNRSLETVLMSESFFVDPKHGWHFRPGVVHSPESESSAHVHFFDIDWAAMSEHHTDVRQFFEQRMDEQMWRFVCTSGDCEQHRITQQQKADEAAAARAEDAAVAAASTVAASVSSSSSSIGSKTLPHPHSNASFFDDSLDRPPMYRFLCGLVFRRTYHPSHRAYMYEFHLPRARPVLVIDLAYPDSSLNLATFRAVSTNVIKGSLAVIPFYGPPQVVNAALERVFDFTDVLHLQHQAEALNLVLEAIMEMQQHTEVASRAQQRTGTTETSVSISQSASSSASSASSLSAASGLTAVSVASSSSSSSASRVASTNPFFNDPDLPLSRLHSSVFYLLRANIMLSSIIKNAVQDNEALVRKYMQALWIKRDQSMHFLTSRAGKLKLDVIPLPGTFFAFGLQRDAHGSLVKLKLYVLVFSKIGRKNKPHAAVDFMNDRRELRKREVLQQLLTVSNLLYVPIPGIGGVVKLAYKEVIIREIHKRQMWEHGLLAHIKHNPGQMAKVMESKIGIDRAIAAKYEAGAIAQLEQRAMSPLDLNAKEAAIHRANVEQWMADQYPTPERWTPVMQHDPVSDSSISR